MLRQKLHWNVISSRQCGQVYETKHMYRPLSTLERISLVNNHQTK